MFTNPNSFPTLQLVDIETNGLINDPRKLDELYCVYDHRILNQDREWQPIYIGHGKFNTHLQFVEARRNSEWQKIATTAPMIRVKLLAFADTMIEASNYAFKLIREQRPHCNIHGRQPTRSQPVRCLQTGMEFETASAAAKHYGISVSAMSNHLNGLPGYKTLHKMIFTRDPKIEE
jgi:hypothetical protein